MDYTALLVEFLLSLRWLWIVVIFLGYRLLRSVTTSIIRYFSLQSDVVIRDTKYSEEEIIKHLDYVITEALDEYVMLNISPKNIYYINTKLENQIVEYLSEEIPTRISKTLITHLSFIYDNEYIGTFLGKHIYMLVLNYCLNFNINNSNEVSNIDNKKIK